MEELNERILPNDYPVHWDYLYVADGVVVRSDIKGTVLDLKRDLNSIGVSCNEIKSYDIAGRRELLGI